MKLLKSTCLGVILLPFATLLAAPSSTYANDISAAVISAAIGDGGPSISNAGTVTQSLCNDQGACEHTFMTVTYADGTASVSGGGLIGGLPYFLGPPSEASGSVTFYFSVVGSKSESVPLIFTGSGLPFYFNPARIEQSVSAEIHDPAGDFQACVSAGFGICNPTSFSFSDTFNAAPNDVYGVTVIGDGGLLCPCTVGGSWSVNVNFGVAIDPSFVDARDFNLDFGPASNVPEPASLVMLAIGSLVLVGFSLKKFVA